MDAGYIVSEENIGTNSLGTSIVTNVPTAVFGNQHFLDVYKKWAGFAAPIHGLNNEILGAMGIYLPFGICQLAIYWKCLICLLKG